MNRNATPTIIRGTTVVPGSRVGLLRNSIHHSRDTHGNGAPPYIEWFDVIATNGESFAMRRRIVDKRRFAYQDTYDEFERWLVSQAEADAALVKELGENTIAYLEADLINTRERIESLRRSEDVVRSRLIKLKFCGDCNPHRPLLNKHICPRCQRRACDEHAEHVCVAHEQSA